MFIVLIMASKVIAVLTGSHLYFCGIRKGDKYIWKCRKGHCDPRLNRREFTQCNCRNVHKKNY